MSHFAQGTIHRASEAFLNGDLFHNSRRGNSHDLACRDRVYLFAYCDSENYWGWETETYWGPEEADGHLFRYMSGMARRIQRCWFNREEQPMACPCPEAPF